MDSSLIKWVKTFDEAAHIDSLGDLADGTIIHRYAGRLLSFAFGSLISSQSSLRHRPRFFPAWNIDARRERQFDSQGAIHA